MVGVTEAAATAPQRYDCTDVTDPETITRAAEAARDAISRGECVVLPTDTVYGIGADAFDAAAVQRLLDAKGRGRDMPPPVLIADARLLRALATDVPADARVLVAAFWPGPLTVICKSQPSLRMDLGDTDGTIALRVPDHELARELLRKTGPMAVSSANLSGRPAAVSCDQAQEMLGGSVAVYLDGGTLGGTADAAPSTIVDFSTAEHGRILRRGALSLEQLREQCPEIEDLVEVAAPEPAPASTAPEADEPAFTPYDVPARLRHTLQPPLEHSAVGAQLAAEDLTDADDVRAAINGTAPASVSDTPVSDTPVPDTPQPESPTQQVS
jgi:tRNA threonylcarbamoyl adenosine modification protein (Sua5/YciO/YrdC/YwlC family)